VRDRETRRRPPRSPRGAGTGSTSVRPGMIQSSGAPVPRTRMGPGVKEGVAAVPAGTAAARPTRAALPAAGRARPRARPPRRHRRPAGGSPSCRSLLFHAGFPLFGGGFVGVDVFFVISGYLITSIILGDLEAGRSSLLAFYERRVRRIFPALFAMILVSLALGPYVLLPDDLMNLGQSAIRSGAVRVQRPVLARGRLFRHRGGAQAAAPYLVAGGRGAVLPRLPPRPAPAPARGQEPRSSRPRGDSADLVRASGLGRARRALDGLLPRAGPGLGAAPRRPPGRGCLPSPWAGRAHGTASRCSASG
jgi:hypothetical protein